MPLGLPWAEVGEALSRAEWERKLPDLQKLRVSFAQRLVVKGPVPDDLVLGAKPEEVK